MIKRFFSLCLVAFMSVMLVAQPALALDTQFYSGNDILFYDDTYTKSDCSDVASVALTGKDNLEKIFNFMINKGLSREQAAGVVGNIYQESGGNPELLQGGKARQIYGSDTTKDPSKLGTSVGVGLAWGLIQWDAGGRAIEYAKKAGVGDRPIHELSTQLEIVWWHMNNQSATGMNNMLAKYRQITDVETAVQKYEVWMEGAGTPMMEKRIKYAKEALATFKGGDTGATIPVGVPQTPGVNPSTPNAPESAANTTLQTTGGCAGGADGRESAHAGDGFVIYTQQDPKWANRPFGSSTTGDAGCGPTSLAMVFTALLGKPITPIETIDVANQNNIHVRGAGSSWAVAPVLAKHFGLRSEGISGDIESVNKVLRAGGMVSTSGQGPAPFTGGGHYIAIRGITADGKWMVADSNGQKGVKNSNTPWDPAFIMQSANKGNFTAIYKK